MNCSNCKRHVDETFDFCNYCGSRLEQPVQKVNDLGIFLLPRDTNLKKNRSKGWIFALVAAALVILILMLNTPSPFRDKFEFPDAKMADLIKKSSLNESFKQACASLSSKIQGTDTKALKSRTNQINAGRFSTRQAATFATKHSWIYDSSDLSSITDAVSNDFKSSLKSLIVKSDPKLASSWVDFQTKHWASDYQSSALDSCSDTSSKYGEVKKVISAYDSARAKVSTLASEVPWFPSGYTEFSAGIAYKWVGGTCQLGDYCWHMSVITENDCPSDLYAEINILDAAGNVVDYTNDAVPYLAAGTKAVLEFSTYNSSADKGQLTKIDCY